MFKTAPGVIALLSLEQTATSKRFSRVAVKLSPATSNDSI